MRMIGQDSLNTRRRLTVDGKDYAYFSLPEAARALGVDLSRLPMSLKILLENVLRFEDGRSYRVEDARAVAEWLANAHSEREVPFRPARILMQDFTGVPAVVDLAAMRDGMIRLHGDPQKVNPLVPVDLVIDHSVMVDHFGRPDAFRRNVEVEFARNGERYTFLRWGQESFNRFRVVPPGTGICHQVNVEYLAQVVWADEVDGTPYAYPDTCFGTDSHTTMVNGLGVLGWGVGGIEAEAAMLGQPIAMLIPDVVGFRLTGSLPDGATATDLVLTVTQMLRRKGVVGKFVEFFGPGLDELAVADRATIANMAPEYGATCGFFPIDAATLRYLELTGRDPHRIRLVETYARAQGLFRDATTPEPRFSDVLELDLSTVQPSLAGPKRPQDRLPLVNVARAFDEELTKSLGVAPQEAMKRVPVAGTNYELGHGDVVIAAITSCTNTSNPCVMIAAGLLARNARLRGLSARPWVKTSLAPGSQVVTEYLEKSGLQADLDALGFNLVGYGCTTCIGNAGPLNPELESTLKSKDLVCASVLSGNRNFEARIHGSIRANFLMSPPLVVAYALAGRVDIDLTNDPLGQDKNGNDIYLKDLWPSSAELQEVIGSALKPEVFNKLYSNLDTASPKWVGVESSTGASYSWNEDSTYIQNPPFFPEGWRTAKTVGEDIIDARPLGIFGDSVTTDHISPAGAITPTSPAGQYLLENGVEKAKFNSFGSRRGNDRVMTRGTFGNVRIKNLMTGGIEGGYTQYFGDAEVPAPDQEIAPSMGGKPTFIYNAAEAYRQSGRKLIVIGGEHYGMGSSRDWAAKGTALLGVQAVLTKSFERIHRSNLIGMGVLPLNFKDKSDFDKIKDMHDCTFSITGLAGELKPMQEATFTTACGLSFPVVVRLDTPAEVDYYLSGGILPYVLNQIIDANS